MQFSTLSAFTSASRSTSDLAALREKLGTASSEATTGRRVDVAGATSGQTGQALLLSKAMADNARHQDMTALSRARMDTAAGAISSIRTSLSGFAARGTIALSQSGTAHVLLASEADSLLDATSAALNTRFGSRYLFSGNRTDRAPVPSTTALAASVDSALAGATDTMSALSAVDALFNDPSGAFASAHYAGGRADGPAFWTGSRDTDRFDPLPRADHAAFRDMLHGLSLVASADSVTAGTDTRDAVIARGLDLVESGFAQALSLETGLGADQQWLSRREDTLLAEAQVLATADRELLGRDQLEAASRVQALEAQLQFSYAVAGRLSNLSLLQFLR